jgi:hypothetical protein
MVIRVQSDHLHSILHKIHVHSSFWTYTPALIDSSRVATLQFGNVMKKKLFLFEIPRIGWTRTNITKQMTWHRILMSKIRDPFKSIAA